VDTQGTRNVDVEETVEGEADVERVWFRRQKVI